MDQLPGTIAECHTLLKAFQQLLKEMSERLAQLEAENRDLKERLNRNSNNSSLPPSQDFKKKKKHPTKIPSTKKSGGQIGHQGHHRELLDSTKVDVIEERSPAQHCECGGAILTQPNNYCRHQVHELPKLKLLITEYRLHKGCCARCKKTHIASLPEGVTWGITGPRLTSLMSELVSKYQLSRRELAVFLEEHLGFRISLGTIFKKQKIVNAALEEPVANLLTLIKQAPALHADETSHNRHGKRQWLWGFVSTTAAFFSVHASRGKKALQSYVGDFNHILISDRYAAYTYFESGHRQLCWAHLKRDFIKLSEKDDKLIARLGKKLLEKQSQLFILWHAFKSGHIDQFQLHNRTQPLRQEIGELLEAGSYTDPLLKAARFCKNILSNFNALWTFLDHPDIEPTNNHAERALRPLVIWRKKYFCTRSDYGSEYVARTASVNMTCKLQKQSSFDYTVSVVQQFFSGKRPSLFSLTP